MMEQTHLYLKPKSSKLCIRDPRSKQRLPEYGARVPNNRYWRARFADGDCIETSAADISEAKKLAAKALEAKNSTNPKSAGKAKKEG